MTRRDWCLPGRLLCGAMAMASAGCVVQPAGVFAPSDYTPVTYVTDPVSGRSDGPFDPATGKRVLTQTGPDGVLRVAVDPVSHTPILLDERGPVRPAVLTPPARPRPPKHRRPVHGGRLPHHHPDMVKPAHAGAAKPPPLVPAKPVSAPASSAPAPAPKPTSAPATWLTNPAPPLPAAATASPPAAPPASNGPVPLFPQGTPTQSAPPPAPAPAATTGMIRWEIAPVLVAAASGADLASATRFPTEALL